MVKTGHSVRNLIRVSFASSSVPGFGFEALDLTEVLQRLGEGHFARPRRLAFYQLMVLEAGSARQEVDFVWFDIEPGMVAFTQPGQVQRLTVSRNCRGRLLLIEPDFLSPGERLADPAAIAPLIQSTAAIDIAVRNLTEESAHVATDHQSRSIIFHDVHALFLRLKRASDVPRVRKGESSEAGKLFRRFEALLEERFTKVRAAGILARGLGCNEKTLSRACATIAGLPPKTLINQRVVLEAKRILAHTGQPVKQISHQLGFTEPTNFVKFFRRMSGELPSAFRTRVRSAM